MESWIFFGRVLPERFPLRMELPDQTNRLEKFDLTYDLRVGIADGQLIADVTITRGMTDVYTLRNLVEINIRTMTDLVGYQNGFAYDVEIISAACRDTGQRCVFGVTIPMLSDRRGGVFTTAVDGSLAEAVRKEAGAQIALANFREAIRTPVDSGFFCYRGIEAMMQSMRVDDLEKDALLWDRFRSVLRIERSAIDYVAGHAKTPRHGRPTAITDTERSTVFKLTDEMIARYLQYIVRGKVPLSLIVNHRRGKAASVSPTIRDHMFWSILAGYIAGFIVYLSSALSGWLGFHGIGVDAVYQWAPPASLASSTIIAVIGGFRDRKAKIERLKPIRQR